METLEEMVSQHRWVVDLHHFTGPPSYILFCGIGRTPHEYSNLLFWIMRKEDKTPKIFCGACKRMIDLPSQEEFHKVKAINANMRC